VDAPPLGPARSQTRAYRIRSVMFEERSGALVASCASAAATGELATGSIVRIALADAADGKVPGMVCAPLPAVYALAPAADSQASSPAAVVLFASAVETNSLRRIVIGDDKGWSGPLLAPELETAGKDVDGRRLEPVRHRRFNEQFDPNAPVNEPEPKRLVRRR
jgi:hypothetical protein